MGSGWYPGRVSWINRGLYVGWIPLAPLEPYYCRRYWGPRSCALPAGRNRIEHFDTKHCRYRNHSVVVRKTSFYKTGDYNTVRVKKINNNFIDNCHRTTHINSRVIRDFKENRERFNFGEQYVSRKPNWTFAKGTGQKRERGSFSGRKDGTPARQALVKRISNRPSSIRKPGKSPRIFSTDKRNRPKRTSFKQQAIKRSRTPLKRSRTWRTPEKTLARTNKRPYSRESKDTRRTEKGKITANHQFSGSQKKGCTPPEEAENIPDPPVKTAKTKRDVESERTNIITPRSKC